MKLGTVVGKSGASVRAGRGGDSGGMRVFPSTSSRGAPALPPRAEREEDVVSEISKSSINSSRSTERNRRHDQAYVDPGRHMIVAEIFTRFFFLAQ